METQIIPIKEIFADPSFNCRGPIAPIDVLDLKESIEKVGLQQPIVVQPFYILPHNWRVIMGHRRFKALELLGKSTIPCIINRTASETDARILNLLENLDRENLNLMQEASAIEALLHQGLTHAVIAKKLSRSQTWVTIRATALKLPPEIQAEIKAGFITQAQVLDIYNIPSISGKYAAVREIKERREAGDKRAIKLRQSKMEKKQLDVKKIRTVQELFKMQDTIRDVLGNNLCTRLIGWATSIVPTREFLEELQKEAALVGKHYEIPDKL